MLKQFSQRFEEGFERTLRTALADARLNSCEYAALEHLLLALLDNREASRVLNACEVDIEGLRSELRTMVQQDFGNPITEHREEPRPTSGFQRVIQRAVVTVHDASRVTGADVLISMFHERQSSCVASLHKFGLSYFDIARYLAHGLTSDPSSDSSPRRTSEARIPAMYRVTLLNDDFTPMDFVERVLQEFFQMDPESAKLLMLSIHHSGVGECGVYTHEVAETKISQVMDFARQHQHPLQCVMEKK